MSKKVVDTPIYVDTYKLVGIVYGLRFSIPKRDRAIPCKHGDAYGVYDLVGGKFYTHPNLTGE